jgi:hypothetical protein
MTDGGRERQLLARSGRPSSSEIGPLRTLNKGGNQRDDDEKAAGRIPQIQIIRFRRLKGKPDLLPQPPGINCMRCTFRQSQRKWRPSGAHGLTLLAISLMSILFVCDPARAQLLPKMLGGYTVSEMPLPVVFRKAGLKFKIPANFIDRPRAAAANPEMTDLLLMALLPDITGRNEQNTGVFGREDSKGKNSLLTVLVNEAQGKPWDMSKITAAYDGRQPGYRLDSRGIEYGLASVRQVPPAVGRWMWNSTYRLEENGIFQTSIICNGAGTVPAPGCQHFFLYKHLLIHMNYQADFLPSWREIEHDVREKLQSWESNF